MKKKLTSFILIALTAIFIVMGIFIPNAIEKNHITYDYEKKLVGLDDRFVITISSGKQYSINSAEVFFENHFGDDLTVVVQGDKITETKDGKYFIYKFEVLIKDGTVNGMLTSVDELELRTSKGIVEVEYDFTNAKASGLPVRIICFIIAGITLIVGVSMFFLNKNKLNNTETYTSVEDEHTETFDNSFGGILTSIGKTLEELGNIEETPKKTFIVCEYCGTENNSENTKCASCGAKISRK